jgi:hypothetical protein
MKKSVLQQDYRYTDMKENLRMYVCTKLGLHREKLKCEETACFFSVAVKVYR